MNELAQALRSALELEAAAIDLGSYPWCQQCLGADDRVLDIEGSPRVRRGGAADPRGGHRLQDPGRTSSSGIGRGEGVIAEVERGGTVTNNHDLKDIWKAHLAQDAQHLFLIVPNSNWKQSGLPRERPFLRVTHRMGAFFGDARREIDVLTCHVFGYGRLA